MNQEEDDLWMLELKVRVLAGEFGPNVTFMGRSECAIEFDENPSNFTKNETIMDYLLFNDTLCLHHFTDRVDSNTKVKQCQGFWSRTCPAPATKMRGL